MPEFPSLHWNARWIALDPDPRHDLGVFALRCPIELDAVPASFLVRLSADQRYKLFVNGEMVVFGPQRGDVHHWFYETVDLAPYLQKGANWISALVWNFGRWAPMAQHTAQTGFVFESASHPEALNTPGSWQIAPLPSWDFKMMHSSPGYFYIDVGPGEILDGRSYPFGWETGREEVAMDWRNPHGVHAAEARGDTLGGTPWMLIPRPIPFMNYSARSVAPAVRRGFVGDSDDHLQALSDGAKLALPMAEDAGAGVRLEAGAKLLLDYKELLCAYPRIALSGPEGTEVVITYAEGLWRIPEEGKWWGEGGKGNRNDVQGKAMHGYQDRIILGKGTTLFEPLWWRTYRYLMIEVIANGSLATPPVVDLISIDAVETGYPLRAESSFHADDADVKALWNVSVRTAQRCAGEHYFDCPYYEQLQYGGDTRIQTLIGYYLGRDRRLQRNAVETMGWSLMENGLTQSRYPSRQTQVIPPFSLWWIMMLYDQMMYDGRDESWATDQNNDIVGGVLKAYKGLVEDKHAGPFWQFADWVPAWHAGVPPLSVKSGVHGMTFALASLAAEFLKSQDLADIGKHTREDIHRRFNNLANYYPGVFSKQEGLIIGEGETLEHASEHAEALYRVCQAMAGIEPDAWPTGAIEKHRAARCTYYFSYYKHLAMFARDDNPFDYLAELKPWKEMIEQGLSTFAENPEPTRSDCHAWSAHPVLGFFQIVAGVTSIAPSWRKVEIRPRPGSLKHFDAHIAHPAGDLNVSLKDGWLSVDTPVEAVVVWKGKRAEVGSGKHRFGE